MTNLTITQDQLDRLNAFEVMLGMMDPREGYTVDEINATVDQLVEMTREDRAAEEPKVERYNDRYPGERTQDMPNHALLTEAERLEIKAMGNTDTGLDKLDGIRYDFVKTELRFRADMGRI